MAIKIHFLNVGHGDCTVVEFPSGNLSVIDINNGKIDEDTRKELYSELGVSELELMLKRAQTDFDESAFLLEKGYDITLTDPVDWLSSKSINSIFRFICTHPDMDHISGLHKIKNSGIGITNFWDVDHSFEKNEEDFDSTKYNYDDWTTYCELRKSTDSPKAIKPLRGHSLDHWKGDNVHILAPTQDLIDIAHEKDHANHLSYVLLVQHENTKIYLCGDATNDMTIPNMLEHYGKDFFKKEEGETIIFKAPHHGRDSGYHKDFLNLIKPDAVIVSVGKKPSTDASNKYRNHSDKVWSTRWKGNISLTCEQNGRATYAFEYDR
ncbi:hypothetical protein GF376_04115 [Candidatus Peregrinibacteria bacterium]|nr:hypothetical protein [Candidatus Peregrinibacteria bacterium]